MEEKQNPAFSRQVNKQDKNWKECHGDTNGQSDRREDEILIQIPKRYEKIINSTLEFCQQREIKQDTNDYIKFCFKIKSLWETQINYRNNPNKIKAEKQKILHPLIYLIIENKKIFLTREDILILLEYPFTINYKHILLTMEKLEIKTVRGLNPREGIIYQWKLYNEWKTRERKLLKYWNYQKENWTNFHEIKDTIYYKIENGDFDQEIQEIRERIKKNHY